MSVTDTAGDAFDPAWNRIVDISRRNNDQDYGEFVARWPLSYYRDRLKQIDFEGFDDVLDVGCGFGHWLAALATLNRNVRGVDVHEQRVGISNALLQDLWLGNASAQVASAVDLPFPNQSFDAVMCYGVFMFLDRDRALSEFHRVLKPGGSLYISTNARGWWLKLAIERFRSNRDLSKLSWTAFWSGRRKGRPNATDLKDAKPLLERHGFTEVKAAGEGRLTANGEPTRLAAHYDATYLGYDCVIDILARKPLLADLLSPSAPAIRVPGRQELLERRIEEALSATTYSYTDALARHPVDDTIETTFAGKPSVVALARTVTRDIDRPAILKRIFAQVVGATRDPGEQVRRCVTFAQKLFYHHFAVQPFEGSALLQDPLELAVFRACRCGSAGRFLIDLLTHNGIEARLLVAACHSSVEAKVDGRWVLLDASLYPPGAFPLGGDGDLLTIAEMVREPLLLDIAPSYVNQNPSLLRAFEVAHPRMAATIDRYLQSPPFPSTGYFAEALSEPAHIGTLRHLIKGCGPDAPADGAFGWTTLVQDDVTPSPRLAITQRPAPIKDVRLEQGRLSWLPAKVYDGGDVIYDVHVSAEPRGWSYDALPVGCTFALPGSPVRTNGLEIGVAVAPDEAPRYVSIVARRADRVDAFHLPSEEFGPFRA